MIRNSSNNPEKGKIVIDLDGPDGNVFNLIGIAITLSKKLGYTSEDIEEVKKQMRSADYDYAVKYLDNNFGQHVILESRKF